MDVPAGLLAPAAPAVTQGGAFAPGSPGHQRKVRGKSSLAWLWCGLGAPAQARASSSQLQRWRLLLHDGGVFCSAGNVAGEQLSGRKVQPGTG